MARSRIGVGRLIKALACCVGVMATWVMAIEPGAAFAQSQDAPAMAKRYVRPGPGLAPVSLDERGQLDHNVATASPMGPPAPHRMPSTTALQHIINPAFLPPSTSDAFGQEAEGACCFLDNSCQVVTGSECQAMNGIYHGNGTVCSEINCSATGQCCAFVDNEYQCSVSTLAVCFIETGGYVWSVPGDCNTSCPSLGACCLGGTSCYRTLDWACALNGGTWLGAETTCDDCTKVTGACCGSIANCSITTADECLTNNGVFQGVNSACVNGMCPSAFVGVCCLDFSCVVMSHADCDFNRGVYFGDMTVCDDIDCFDKPQAGACCVGGACFYTTEEICLDNKGTFSGVGIDCDSAECEATGACCIDFECLMRTQADCANERGVYYGDFTDCFGINCFDSPEAGACCLPDNSCRFTTESICLGLNGIFQSVDTTCKEAACGATGACCMINGACEQLTESACLQNGYQWNGVGTLCTEVECIAPLGRCCMFGEQCAVVDIDECFAGLSGYVWSIPGDCAELCDPAGACCADGGCFTTSQEICEVWVGGVYRGDNTTCTDNNGDFTADACDTCVADIAPAPNGNGVINVADLLAIIGGWGACQPQPSLCSGDIAPPGGNGTVNVGDLLAVIGRWGPCSAAQ